MSACPAPARSVAAPAGDAATRAATMAARTPLPTRGRLDGCFENRADQPVGRVLGGLDRDLAAELADRRAGGGADRRDPRARERARGLMERGDGARRGEDEQVGRERCGALLVAQ